MWICLRCCIVLLSPAGRRIMLSTIWRSLSSLCTFLRTTTRVWGFIVERSPSATFEPSNAVPYRFWRRQNVFGCLRPFSMLLCHIAELLRWKRRRLCWLEHLCLQNSRPRRTRGRFRGIECWSMTLEGVNNIMYHNYCYCSKRVTQTNRNSSFVWKKLVTNEWWDLKQNMWVVSTSSQGEKSTYPHRHAKDCISGAMSVQT